uniref:Uncharacterized protein n=1 Tax=Janibacter limosus TaxID=53458 RepID=A0AC61U2T2_9MICO|nr:hypothetical protein [Janibacter limosus]
MTPCTLARQTLLGGDVTRWDLDDTSLERWDASPPDQRPPSHDQLGRLHEDPDGSNRWSARIGLSVLLPDATTESVGRTLTEWFRQHESLRSHLTLDDEQPHRRTLAPEHVDFTPVVLGGHDPEALRELLTHEFHTRCRPTRRPACALFTVEVEHGHVLHAAFDHITFDGLSAYAAVGHLAGLHTAVVNEVHRPHTSPSHVDPAATEIAVCEDVDTGDERLGPRRDFLRGGRIPAAPAASGIDPEGRYDHDLVRHDICSGDVACHARAAVLGGGHPHRHAVDRDPHAGPRRRRARADVDARPPVVVVERLRRLVRRRRAAVPVDADRLRHERMGPRRCAGVA